MDTIKHIPTLNPRDQVFIQYMKEVEKSYQDIAARRDYVVGFYKYTVTNEDTLVLIAARCSIPYEEIAIINQIDSHDTPLTGKTLLLPNAPGLFVPKDPTSNLGILVKSRLYDETNTNWYNISGRIYQYFNEERLTPTERAYFLDTTLRIPLDSHVLTSDFGIRESPISGMEHFHKGIDLAAPMGSSVYACKAGTVAIAGVDNVYGNYIILDHDNKTQSVYAHLSVIEVETGEKVNKGHIIGKVGSTGASTGPHLHFEIRVNGSAQDPRRLLPSI
ncbi:MAG: M23 family metallopeptidase [Spirochaetia bacterium]|nr:M23 family metallopeptidase [Spirochaetia bacterium]